MKEAKKVDPTQREGLAGDNPHKGLKKGERERLEKHSLNKKVQKELTLNISQAYLSIKPTIIQAQRILKIIENLSQKVYITKFLNYEFVKHFDNPTALEQSGLKMELVNRLTPITRNFLGKISKIQNTMHNLLVKDVHSVSEVGEEEEEQSNRFEDDEELEKKQALESEHDREEQLHRILREKKVMELRLAMDGDFNNLVRQLEKEPNDFKIIQVSFLV